MSTGLLAPVPIQRAITNLGEIADGALLLTQLSGSSTNSPVYTTSALNVEHTNPVVADADGLFPAIYLDPAIVYRMTLTESDGTAIWGPQDGIAISTVVLGANTFTARQTINVATEQLRLGYNTSNYASFTVGADGTITLAPTGTNPNIVLTPGGTGHVTISSGLTAGSGAVAILDATGKIPAISSTYFASLSGSNLTNVALLDAANLFTNNQTITKTTTQLKLNYSVGTGTSFTVNSGGGLTIAPPIGAVLYLNAATVVTGVFSVNYDINNYSHFTTNSVGSLIIAATGTNPSITLTPGGTGKTVLGGVINAAGLPTSSAGLASGDLWVNSGVVTRA